MIFTGEALEHMKDMPTETFDAVVTDPPFGIGFKYNEKEKISNPQEYGEWIKEIYQESMRVLKPGGFLAIWQTQLHFPYFWDWFGNDIHIYCAAKNFVQLRKTPINYGYDPVIMKYKSGGVPLRPLKPKRNIDFHVANTAALVSNPNRIERRHPCPRPLDTVRIIIENFTCENAHILDPFLGSGTVGIAALKTGRTFYGIEIDAVYSSLAKERIVQETMEIILLEEAAKD